MRKAEVSQVAHTDACTRGVETQWEGARGADERTGRARRPAEARAHLRTNVNHAAESQRDSSESVPGFTSRSTQLFGAAVWALVSSKPAARSSTRALHMHTRKHAHSLARSPSLPHSLLTNVIGH